MIQIINRIVLTLIAYLCLNSVQAQTKMNVDDAFSKARDLGFSGKRAEARELSRQILLQSPNYHDVKIFIGRMYNFDKMYDSARVVLNEVIVAKPDYADAYVALMDTEIWSGNPKEAIKIADKGFANLTSPQDELSVKKARALRSLEKNDEAYIILTNVIESGNRSSDILAFAETVKRDIQVKKIGLNYSYDSFSDTFAPWHAASLSYSQRTKVFGSLIGRVNYANRFGINGYQFEVDAYPSLGKGAYLYVNAGYSESRIFPNYRVGSSAYFSLPKSYELDFGFRYLKFSSATTILTGSIGKYTGNFWLNLRSNYVLSSSSVSFNFTTRYYTKSAEDYLTIVLSTGISPDERERDLTTLTANLKSFRARISYQHLFKSNIIFNTGIGYASDEITTSKFRTDLTLFTGLEFLFK